MNPIDVAEKLRDDKGGTVSYRAGCDKAIDHILDRAKAHGVVAGIHNAGPEAARKRIEKGVQFVTIGSDAGLMAAGAQQVIRSARTGAPQPASRPTGY